MIRLVKLFRDYKDYEAIFAGRIISSLSMTRTEFDRLVVSMGRKLYAHAYRILEDKEGSEDAVQEVFVRMWKMRMKLDEYESIEALSMTMLKNYCIDQFRKRRLFDQGGEAAFAGLYDKEPSPQEQIERGETSDIILRIIEKLPDQYREIIRMRDIEELGFEEIAKMTGRNVNSVRVILSRARKNVREEFRKQIR